jgi:hypothetical protein
MKRSPARLQSPLAYAAVGASILAIPAPAAADGTPNQAADGTPNQTGSGSTIKARVKRRKITYHHDAVVVGRAPSSERGQAITLQFSSTATGGWRELASARIGSDGSFRLVAALSRSGWLRATTAAPVATASAIPLSGAGTSASAPLRVDVAAAVRLRARAINELGARPIKLRGTLRPGGPGHMLVLQGKRSGRWVTLSWARTDRRGAFTLRYRPHGPGQQRLRVRFAGDRGNAAASSRAGSLTVYRQTVASWYDDGGSTACGFHAYYGVASLSLPCGSAVSFSYHGRTVKAVVDDRGPYVSGRAWDLNQNTAAALGFAGVATVWSSH